MVLLFLIFLTYWMICMFGLLRDYRVVPSSNQLFRLWNPKECIHLLYLNNDPNSCDYSFSEVNGHLHMILATFSVSFFYLFYLNAEKEPVIFQQYGLKSWYRYQTMAFCINIVNIGPDIARYYRANILSGTSKPDTILLIHIGLSWYLKLCSTILYIDALEDGTFFCLQCLPPHCFYPLIIN